MFARHKSTIGSNFHFYFSRFKFDNLCFYPHDVVSVSTVYATATWLGGWLDVCPSHAGIVSKRINLVLKLFRPSGSPIILVSYDPCTDTQFQGYPRALQRARALNTHGVGKIGDFRAIFDGNCRLFSGAR